MLKIFEIIARGSALQSALALLGLVIVVLMAVTITIFFVMFWVLAIREAFDRNRRKKKGGEDEPAKKFKVNYKLN